MDERSLRSLLDEIRAGSVGTDEAVERLKSLPFASLADANATVDTHRALRQGIPEVVYGAGKSVPQVVDIACTIAAANGAVLVTRVDAAQAAALEKALPAGVHQAASRTFRVGRAAPVARRGPVALVTAGTSDAPVAAEATATLEFLGVDMLRIDDAGVAGLHRIAARRAELERATAIIVIAGMEGALASVIAGLVSKPVIAVPTSVGYGASFGGLAALLGMLSSCAAGVGVVNIDNGFGAAVLAAQIVRA